MNNFLYCCLCLELDIEKKISCSEGLKNKRLTIIDGNVICELHLHLYLKSKLEAHKLLYKKIEF